MTTESKKQNRARRDVRGTVPAATLGAQARRYRQILESERELSAALRNELSASARESAELRDLVERHKSFPQLSAHAQDLEVALSSTDSEIHELRRGSNVMRSALSAIGLLVREYGDANTPRAISPSPSEAIVMRSALRAIGLLVEELSR